MTCRCCLKLQVRFPLPLLLLLPANVEIAEAMRWDPLLSLRANRERERERERERRKEGMVLSLT